MSESEKDFNKMVPYLSIGFNNFTKFRPTFAVGPELHTLAHIIPEWPSGRMLTNIFQDKSCLDE